MESNLGMKGLSWLPGYSPSSREANAVTWRGKNWSRDHGRMSFAGLLPMAYSANFLIQPRPPARDAKVSIVNWAFPHATSNQDKFPPVNLMEAIPQLRVSFLGMNRFVANQQKLPSTVPLSASIDTCWESLIFRTWQVRIWVSSCIFASMILGEKRQKCPLLGLSWPPSAPW